MKTLREYIDQLDEISRRDFLKGAGSAAGLAAIGGAGYQQGRIGVYETKVAESLGFIEGFLESMPDRWSNDLQIKRILQTYNYWSKRLDPKIRSTDAYKLEKSYAQSLFRNTFTQDYMNTESFKNDVLEHLIGHIKSLQDNAGYISTDIDEELDEASEDAVKRIEELTKYK